MLVVSYQVFYVTPSTLSVRCDGQLGEQGKPVHAVGSIFLTDR